MQPVTREAGTRYGDAPSLCTGSPASQKKEKGLRLLCTPRALYTCCSLDTKPGTAGAPLSCMELKVRVLLSAQSTLPRELSHTRRPLKRTRQQKFQKQTGQGTGRSRRKEQGGEPGHGSPLLQKELPFPSPLRRSPEARGWAPPPTVKYKVK